MNDRKKRIQKIIAFKVWFSQAKPEAVELLKELCEEKKSNWAMNAHEMAYRAGKKDVWRDIQRLQEIPLDKLNEEDEENVQY
jgi:hypothetical protein